MVEVTRLAWAGKSYCWIALYGVLFSCFGVFRGSITQQQARFFVLVASLHVFLIAANYVLARYARRTDSLCSRSVVISVWSVCIVLLFSVSLKASVVLFRKLN